jgi:hypothetical protein
MEKEELEKLINQGLSTYQISDLLKKSPTTVRYWIKKFSLKTVHLSIKDKKTTPYGDNRYCPRCKEIKPLPEFYTRRNKEGSSVYCKPCTSNQTSERQRKLKELAVNYKGGCCIKCGYNKYNGALEFHHLDPSKKDFTIAHLNLHAFNEKIKKELDKCILVCSNCHREIHGNIN